MSKPRIKVGFTDYYATFDEFFMDVLSREYEVERNDADPNYLFFCDETFGTNHKNYKNCIKIFFTGENRRPWNYETHFALSFDHLHTSQFYRLPLYVLDNWVQMNKIKLPDFLSGGIKHDKPQEFCSFIVANGSSSDRNNIFHKLSEYKKIASAGPLFNNVGFVLPRNGINAQLTKFEFMRKYKFNLCYENSSYPGYVSEKLFHALYMNVVPIYWGSPCVEMDFNPEAFINRLDFDSDENMIEYIKKVDTDDELYEKMINANKLNPRNKVFDLNRFLRWFRENVYKQ